MWKLLVAFAAFAAVALYFIAQGGDTVDMSGEKHGSETHAPAAADPAPVQAAPASAASS